MRISSRSSLNSDPGEAGGGSKASDVEPEATAVYKVDHRHKGPRASEGQRRTDSSFSPLVTPSVTRFGDNGGSATFIVEDGDDGKSISIVFAALSAQVSLGSGRDCCRSSYTPISETTFSSSAFDNISPSHTSYRDIRNRPSKYRLLTCL